MPGCHAVIILWIIDSLQDGVFSPGFGRSSTQSFQSQAIEFVNSCFLSAASWLLTKYTILPLLAFTHSTSVMEAHDCLEVERSLPRITN